ncbi:peptidylprolyl isomerase [Paenibacillus sp.]|uniref:peptidylprolyl isomerase n=1 Tax=Paenibacillus sp. TaxID=58172 RepID=UPI002D69EDB5|nr:peptidylprolyl isomerase [Paenibacillus sp.]HZG88529.1 peptidylprolyl isomerase [Paenibacillus sp.]
MSEKEKTVSGSSNAGAGGGKGKIILPWALFAATAIGFAVYAGVQANEPNVSTGNVGDEAVATVDNEAITANELYQTMLKQVGSQAVDQLITERLINRAAAAQNIQVTDEDLNAEIEKIKANFPDEATFNQQLAMAGYTLESLKEQLSPQVKLTKLVEPEIQVTDEDIQSYYDENKASYETPEQVRASHILVDSKEEAEKLLADLKGGADFAELAKEHSKDTGSAVNGGDLNYFGKGQMVPEFEEAAFALDVGQVSDIVESQYGFHIIKVTDKKAATTATLEEKKEEIRETLFEQKVNERSTAYLEELRSAAKIENSLATEEAAS